MNEIRCAWCGEKLDHGVHGTTFCGKACQAQFESWCRSRAIARTEAVSRWRNSRVVAKTDRFEGLTSTPVHRPNSSAGVTGPTADR